MSPSGRLGGFLQPTGTKITQAKNKQVYMLLWCSLTIIPKVIDVHSNSICVGGHYRNDNKRLIGVYKLILLMLYLLRIYFIARLDF